MGTLHLLAGIAFNPQIRGFLAVGVGVVVLMGSVYLILATNTGNRLGFLLAATGFFGWMTIMGAIWWIYGIGMLGTAPSWKVVEYNAEYDADITGAAIDEVNDLNVETLLAHPELDAYEIEDPETGETDTVSGYEALRAIEENDPALAAQLNSELQADWRFLAPSNPARGEAEATVAAHLPSSAEDGCSTCSFGIENAEDYKVLSAFEVGGKNRRAPDASSLERAWRRILNTFTIKNPEHYAVVQVQRVIEQETAPGEAPPTPIVNPDEPVISVVMIRDIGDRRFPSAMITLGSGLIFGLLCWLLHQRERILEANLAAAGAA